MNKLANLVATGKITVEELSTAPELIERAQLVKDGISACNKTLHFPMGVTEINCYSYMDSAGEYEAWGTCDNNGNFTCSCNWGGDHIIGQVNILNSSDVFMAFENQEFSSDLKRFLKQQIDKVTKPIDEAAELK